MEIQTHRHTSPPPQKTWKTWNCSDTLSLCVEGEGAALKSLGGGGGGGGEERKKTFALTCNYRIFFLSLSLSLLPLGEEEERGFDFYFPWASFFSPPLPFLPCSLGLKACIALVLLPSFFFFQKKVGKCNAAYSQKGKKNLFDFCERF